MKRIGVLASGEGTNLQAIVDAAGRGEIAGRVVLVLSDNEEAGALDKARKAGIKALYINSSDFENREKYDRALVRALEGEKVELVVLAGFMRKLSPVMVNSFPNRILNIHPSLLPAFPGLDGAKQALHYGVKVTGCTVHFVDEGLDSGPVIMQESVPVLQVDTLKTLQQRIHAAEYRNYPRAIDLFCRGMLKIKGRRCEISEQQ